MAKLMAFRTTYLRAIAKAWADPQFSERLISNPISAMRDYFDFEWPWPTMCHLEIVVPGRAAWWESPYYGAGIRLRGGTYNKYIALYASRHCESRCDP